MARCHTAGRWSGRPACRGPHHPGHRPSPVAAGAAGHHPQLETAIKARLTTCSRTALFAGLPGVGSNNVAQVLAEVSPILDRVTSAEQAAVECGAAPMTKESGKSRGLLPLGRQHPCPQSHHRLRPQLPAVSHLVRPVKPPPRP
ncbi:transposase [Streptomyces mauvecolor]